MGYMCVFAGFYSEDEDEEEDCFIMFTTSESRCDDLFDRGLDMVAQGDPVAALNIFLDTLTALQECQYTNKLLPTLFQLGDAYRVLGETEKSREISDTVSLLQEALEDAMKEKYSRKVGTLWEQKDSGSLYLQKAEVRESLAQDLEKNGDFERALEYSESVFRIRQYTLGPQNPTTVRTLSNLIPLYTRAGKTVHVTHFRDPIIFTSVIRSSCPPETQSSCTEPSTPLSTPTPSSESTHSPCLESTTLSSCSETSCSEASTPTSHTAQPISCPDHNVLSLDSATPRSLQASPNTTIANQEVCIHSLFASGDKLQLECSTKCGLESSTAAVSHHSLSDTANPVSYYTLLIAVSIIAVTALSFYI